MTKFSSNSKGKFFGSTLFTIFGIIVGIATLASIFLAFKQNTETRSKAATGARRVIKIWSFNGTSTEQWRKISGGGNIQATGGNLTFQLLHQGLIKILNSERILIPQGTKYIRFAILMQKPIMSQPQTGQMCDVTRLSCPSGYKCVQTGVDADARQSAPKGRCIKVQPTLADSGIVPVTIKATMVNTGGVPSKPLTISTKVIADGAVHVYDLKLTDQLSSFSIQDLAFEFTDVITGAQRSQIIKIDQIALEVLPIVKPSGPKPTGKGTITPTAMPLINDERRTCNYSLNPPKTCPSGYDCIVNPKFSGTNGVCEINDDRTCNYSLNPPKTCPSGYDCITISKLRGADGVCQKAVITTTADFCWNQVFWSNNTYNWPNSCRGMKKAGAMCSQAITPLTSAEIVAFKSWDRKPINGCQ